MRNKWFKIPLILLGKCCIRFWHCCIYPSLRAAVWRHHRDCFVYTASLRTACCDNCVGNQPFHVAVGLVCFGEKFCIHHYS